MVLEEDIEFIARGIANGVRDNDISGRISEDHAGQRVADDGSIALHSG
jgi:hypothetical protein